MEQNKELQAEVDRLKKEKNEELQQQRDVSSLLYRCNGLPIKEASLHIGAGSPYIYSEVVVETVIVSPCICLPRCSLRATFAGSSCAKHPSRADQLLPGDRVWRDAV